MKKILNYILCAFVFIGVMPITTHAKATYTAYKAGDKITVNVNDTTQKVFYVLEESNTTSNTVTAIYEEVLGDAFWFGATSTTFAGSTAETTLKTLTSDWTNPTQIRLINANEIMSDVTLSTSTGAAFTIPSYLNIGKNYWTQDVVVEDGTTYATIISAKSNYSSISITSDNTTTAYIRPVITINKEYIVNDNVDYDAELEKFVETFKNTEWMGMLTAAFEEGSELKIEHTISNLKVILTGEEDGETYTYTTNFTYANGILKYVPYTTVDATNVEYAFVDELWILNAVYALGDLKGYDDESLDEWLGDENDYTLEKDGIILKTDTYEESYEDESISSSISLEYVTDFRLDIVNGLPTYEEYAKNHVATEEPKVDNPNTGIINYGVIALAIVAVVAGIYVGVRKKNKLPHA